MDETYMEKLARAYNERLRGAESPEYTEARRIAEEQTGILDRMSMRPVPLYLKSLKSATLSELKALEGAKSVPTNKAHSGTGGFNRLTELQIELFIALDTLEAEGKDMREIVLRETRFAAFLALMPLQNR